MGLRSSRLRRLAAGRRCTGKFAGRRELLHGHGTETFIRSEVISMPEAADYVIVRANDIRHGFGGQAMRVDMHSGETIPFDEGSGPAPRSRIQRL